MFKYIFILIGMLMLTSTDIEAQRRTRTKRSDKSPESGRVTKAYKPVRKVPKPNGKLLTFEIRPDVFYQHMSMGDYHAFRAGNPIFKKLPAIHNQIGFGIEFACFYQKMMGGGIGIEMMDAPVFRETSVIDFEREGDKFTDEYAYSFVPMTVPLLITFYYTPPVPVVRVTAGAGIGIYMTSAYCYISKKEWYHPPDWPPIPIEEHSTSGDLKGNSLGFHIGARGDYPILKWLSVYVDTKVRIAKVSPLEGKLEVIDNNYLENKKSTSTIDGKLWFDEETKMYGPDDAKLKEKGLRDGSVDFSGIKIGAGVMFRF